MAAAHKQVLWSYQACLFSFMSAIQRCSMMMNDEHALNAAAFKTLRAICDTHGSKALKQDHQERMYTLA